MHRHWLTRVAIVFAALLQVLAAPVAAIADASLEREAARFGKPVTHVESSDSAKCPRVHATECALCHAVASLDATVRSTCSIAIIAAASHPAMSSEAAGHTSARFSRARPRAPPTA